MQFTSNAFIVSTVALLSLMTPVVNAAAVADIISPAAGDKLYIGEMLNVKWYVVKRRNPSPLAVCHHRSLTAGITAGTSPTARAWMVLRSTYYCCILVLTRIRLPVVPLPVRTATLVESRSI
jgi:hypothetical protein